VNRQPISIGRNIEAKRPKKYPQPMATMPGGIMVASQTAKTSAATMPARVTRMVRAPVLLGRALSWKSWPSEVPATCNRALKVLIAADSSASMKM